VVYLCAWLHLGMRYGIAHKQYIDATKKGGIGRFANHSCNPNSEVQKWVVGRRLRMGIFTKRDVERGEEITFNYNVDRYG
jgi:SET domain-containing protein